ncbi:MAG: DUF2116 family Zn-ribbon domain-containing protein, partial [Chlorobi bacterium]|nr:DUF2116 family Zn-ribbon domain-containing protein [Chlorobiota bacterium]
MHRQARVCLECGTPLTGRSDKKFCSDYCRNAYHNRKNRETNSLVRRINARLRKNHRILSSFNPDGKTKIPRRKLTDAGFDFDYYTSCYRTRKGEVYH